jgi:D-alanine-D-alanine ligase-like ATP-grasp enzyme
MTSSASEFIAAQKDLAYKLVESLGGYIPMTSVLAAKEDIMQNPLLGQVGKVVVKPVDGYGSRGVTCDIESHAELKNAVVLAREYAESVVIQEQVYGEEVRFTIIDGTVVSVLLRQAPGVTGDGHSTVAELVRRENEARKDLRMNHVTYPLLTANLIDEAYITDGRVLAEGERLAFNHVTMVKQGASMYEIIDDIDPSYITMATQLASGLDSGFLVVDMFIADYRAVAARGNVWFNEFNTSPALRMYYAARNKDMSHIADQVIELTDRRISS